MLLQSIDMISSAHWLVYIFIYVQNIKRVCYELWQLIEMEKNRTILILMLNELTALFVTEDWLDEHNETNGVYKIDITKQTQNIARTKGKENSGWTSSLSK